ncbi:MAG: peptide chain release factor N(5)-glutamine methyltransferase [Prevotella sp.]|nr:peptide chain release factor N(5)-glutamine methyltransferase [Prevotella sp.]
MTYQQLWKSLTPLYDPGEAQAIVRTLLEERFGMTMTDILCDGISHLDNQQLQWLSTMMQRLCKAEPVQYVLGEAPFMQRMMKVEPGVLIPRPETETLCQWIIDDPHPAHPQVMDVGCGCGCIAITLALGLEQAHVVAVDLSERALDITRANADAHRAPVVVERRDALALESEEERWDIIVSNPPYIRESETATMHSNVVCHEPREALFVPDSDPLLFYRAIARYATTALRHGAPIYFECNTSLVEATAQLLSDIGLVNVVTRDDQFGKPRFIKAIRP